MGRRRRGSGRGARKEKRRRRRRRNRSPGPRRIARRGAGRSARRSANERRRETGHPRAGLQSSARRRRVQGIARSPRSRRRGAGLLQGGLSRERAGGAEARPPRGSAPQGRAFFPRDRGGFGRGGASIPGPERHVLSDRVGSASLSGVPGLRHRHRAGALRRGWRGIHRRAGGRFHESGVRSARRHARAGARPGGESAHSRAPRGTAHHEARLSVASGRRVTAGGAMKKEQGAGTMTKLDLGVGITWIGHGTVLYRSASGKNVLADAWVDTNPVATPEAKALPKIHVVLLTHAHNDHVADLPAIVKKHDPEIVCIHEMAEYYEGKGMKKVHGMSKGGTVTVEGIRVTMVHAIHSSSFDGIDSRIPAG